MSHSSKYTVDSDAIGQHGLDVGTIAGQIQSAMNLMDRKLTALQGTWTGSAAAQYAVLHGDWSRAQARMKDSLADIDSACVCSASACNAPPILPLSAS